MSDEVMNARCVSTLEQRRLHAAHVSQGTSGEPIYRAAAGVVEQLSLSGDLLEFGAGTGTLLTTLVAGGFSGRITGADLLARPEGIPDQIAWVRADLNDPLPLPGEAFDSIVSTEVIEHLENPRAVFREFRRLLRPGGHLVLSTPNQESIRSLASLATRGHFVAFLDTSYPAHLTALLRLDLTRLCAESGFSSPSFSYTDDGAIPRLPHMRWQDVSFGLLKGRLFSDNFLMIATRVR